MSPKVVRNDVPGHLILFVYREEMYAKEKTPQEAKGVAEIIIGKNRSGPMRDVKLACLSQFTRFEDRRRTSNRTSRFFRTTCGLYSS